VVSRAQPARFAAPRPGAIVGQAVDCQVAFRKVLGHGRPVLIDLPNYVRSEEANTTYANAFVQPRRGLWLVMWLLNGMAQSFLHSTCLWG
jgi:hypothetical protein